MSIRVTSRSRYTLVRCGCATLVLLQVMGGRPAHAAAQPPPAAAADRRKAGTEGGLEDLLASRPVVNQALTVDQAVEIALRESPVVRGAVAEVDAAAGRVAAARAERLPWASANLFASGGSNASVVAGPPVSQPQMIMGLPGGGFVDANLMVMFPLFTSGRLQSMVRQAAAQRNASKADLEAQRQEVALMTRMAFREVAARRSLVDVWTSRLREDQERLRVDQAQEREGRVPAFYVLRDEAEAAASRQELTNAARDVELAFVQLKTVMGVSLASRFEVPGALEFQPSGELIKSLGGAPPSSPGLEQGALSSDLATLLRVAQRRRPELQAAGQRIRAAAAETASVRGAYGPQVSLFAMGDALNRNPNAGATFGAVASLPLFNGGQRRARIQTAEAERRRQEQERQRTALQVGQEVSSALLNLRAAEQNVGTAQTALTAAREDYRVARMRYEAGRSVAVEALDALAARTRAESSVVQALFQYNVARDRLLRAVGDPAPVNRRRTNGEAALDTQVERGQ